MRMRTGVVLLLLAAGSAPAQDKAPRNELAASIDRLLESRWSSLKDGPAAPADDAEFLRRVSLDLRGHPAPMEEVIAFLQDSSPAKRSAKIDEYLASDAWAVQTSQWFAQVLLDNYRNVYVANLNGKTRARVAGAFQAWLREQVAKDVPVVQVLKELLEAQGKTNENPAVLYKLSMFTNEPPHLEFAERLSKSWLGVRVGCARCHEHPFDRWTQEDYYGLAGFFTKHKVKGHGGAKDNADEFELYEDPKAADLQNPEGGGVLKPKFLYGGTVQLRDARMPPLVAMLASREHNQLARNFANRSWAWFMGRGLVHPVDDFNQKNRPSHVDLLEALTREFAAHRFSLKHLARGICNSRAYQLASARSEAGDVKDFARGSIRQLTASQLYNSVAVALRGTEGILDREGGPNRDGWNWYAGQMALVYGASPWTEVTPLPGNPRQMLLLRNGEKFQDWFREFDTLPAKLAESQQPADVKVRTAFLSVLGRMPSAAEAARWGAWLQKHPRPDGLSDFLWTLLNSTEFVTRH